MKFSDTTDRTKMAFYVIYNILQNDTEDQIENMDDLREFLNYGIEQCDYVVEDKSKIKETKEWYRKAIDLTQTLSFDELKLVINNNANKYGFTK